MCGRYAASRSPEDLVEEFEVDRVDRTDGLAPDWNVAPTKSVPGIITRPPRGEDPEVADAVRQLTVLQWGLVPFWAKDPKIGNRMINARTETVHEKPAFRQAFSRRRCLLPADGYYEWYATQQLSAKGKPLKQPFYIHPRDGGSLAMAGLYEIWRDKEIEDRDDPAAFRWTCTVLTTSATDDIGRLHDRMPLLVEQERWGQWLDPTLGSDDPETLLGLLVPAAPGRLEAWPVSKEVNAVRNNGAHLTEPLPLDDVPDDVRDGVRT